MRALTICQPFASLIMSGAKRVENRTWATKYRGRFYVHAGMSREWLTNGPRSEYESAYGIPVAAGARRVSYLDRMRARLWRWTRGA